jgi:formylglycine-generating enzyme required for sulfatase activity
MAKKKEAEYEDIFKEAMTMDKIAGEYVPEPLNCGYVNALQQEKPYFVTEYIEGALDGEAWIEKYGKLDVSTGLSVGLEIAKGLQLAHEHKIYHLDLKPANLLLKRTKTGIMVKIIDFGLARVAVSLRQEALSRSSAMTEFGQGIVGTLYYAAPEQMGETQYGKPGPKSDLYAFGATLYRLMSGEKPDNLNPHYLAEAPPGLFDLLCDCRKNDPAHRPASAQAVVNRLKKIKARQSRRGKSSFFRTFVGIAVVVVATLSWFYLQPDFGITPPQTSFEEQARQLAEENDLGPFYLPKEPDIGITPPQTSFEEQAPQLAEENDLGQKQVFRDSLKDGSLGPEMVVIPAGRMGGYDHWISVKSFAIGKYEVTFAEYDKFAEATGREKPSDKGWGRGNRPVINVSWHDATAYAKWLSVQTGQKYRLPTDAEWEYAAGTETHDNELGSNKANCYGDYCGDSFEYTAPVGSFEPNPFGLYDTLGNVWEWTGSEDNANNHVICGGSWFDVPMSVPATKCSRRSDENRSDDVGFRLAL